MDNENFNLELNLDNAKCHGNITGTTLSGELCNITFDSESLSKDGLNVVMEVNNNTRKFNISITEVNAIVNNELTEEHVVENNPKEEYTEEPVVENTPKEEYVAPTVIEEVKPVEENKPIEYNDYKIWVKDTLYGKGYELADKELVWTRPIDHSYNVYIEGPAGVKIYPQIAHLKNIYSTPEELTHRGPRIGFNRLKSIPMTLKGEGVRVEIGTDLGPGSAIAKGYNGYLRFITEDGDLIKELNIRFD